MFASRLRSVMIQQTRRAGGGEFGPPAPKMTMAMAKAMIPSAAGYGGFLALTGLYLSDWKLILQYLPFYNGKFEESD